ncbi:MAG: fused MFS/spermidine synthase [Coriobacteriia bacterium]|nr:fused MFS/spermidine synthase [Coriobacteriia bacterium]MBN2821758.1 fused MFS/spermidine synthase [Coriobacteriia bacterium]
MLIYFIVFSCGACLMGLEILGARVLAPVMGNSIFVWGSVISSFMAAMSAGYWLGGAVSDRFGASRSLGTVIGSAGIWTALSPLVADVSLEWAGTLGPRVGSLVATTLIFTGPAFLLAMVSPMGVKLVSAKGLGRIGRSAGGLYAISTGGSIFGTLATAFWLIPLMQVEPLTIGIGLALTVIAFVSLGLPGADPDDVAPRELGVRWMGVTVTLAVVGVTVGSAMLMRAGPDTTANSDGEAVIFRQDTQYHRITVTEADGVRYLRFDKSRQSGIELEDGYTSVIKYPDYMHLTLAANPDAKRVLVLGLGGGTITKRMWRDYPEMTIDSVEIDPAVSDVAGRFFGLPEDERLTTHIADARRFVQESDELYDIIIIDAYYADSLPFHLTTEEFLQEVKARLAPGGVMAYNVISSVEGERSELFRSMYRTATGVYDHLWVFPIGIGRDNAVRANRNIIVLATDEDFSEAELRTRVSGRVDGRVTIEGFKTFGQDLYTAVIPLGDVPKLTDGYAPTDSLIHVN